jgi:ribosomal-protein-alanine N-acetyltransferase
LTGKVLETERLVLRHLTTSDADFIQELVNDPDWLRYIGDKNVRNPEDALRYLREVPLEMYRSHGHGLYAIELKVVGEPIGICGLIRRKSLPDVDLGFALLP